MTASLEVKGRLLAPVGVDRVVPLPLVATARLAWQTRRLKPVGEFHGSLRAVRSFATAVSSVQVDRRTTESSLNPLRRTIVSEGTPSGLRHYSLEGPLSGDEIELLALPADPLALLGLLPLGQVPHDHSWTPGRWTLPLVTGLDAITGGTLKGRLVKVTDTTAEARRRARSNSQGKCLEYIGMLFDKGVGRKIYKRDPEMSDADCNLDFLMDEQIIAGDVDEVVRRLLLMVEETGQFGTLVMMGYDWDDKESWLHSTELFAKELIPALNKALGRSK